MRKYEPIIVFGDQAIAELKAKLIELTYIVTEADTVMENLNRIDLTDAEIKHWEQRGKNVVERDKAMRED